jgi:hypothetical protein
VNMTNFNVQSLPVVGDHVHSVLPLDHIQEISSQIISVRSVYNVLPSTP